GKARRIRSRGRGFRGAWRGHPCGGWNSSRLKMNTWQKGRMPTRIRPHPALNIQKRTGGSQVRVAGAEQGGEARRLHLAAFAFARLFKVPMVADGLERAIAIDFFLQSSQCLLNRLAFFQSNVCQFDSHPLRRLRGNGPDARPRPASVRTTRLNFCAVSVKCQNERKASIKYGNCAPTTSVGHVKVFMLD